MKCPSCQAEVAQGTAICPECDYIIDKSFLGTGYTDETSQAAGGSEGTTPGEAEESAAPSDDVERELARLRRRRRLEENRPQPLRISEEAEEGDLEQEAGKLFADVIAFLKRLWSSYQALPRADKLTVGGAAGAFVGAFLPWVSVAGLGAMTLLGIEVDGFLLVVLAAAATAAVVLRKKPHWQVPERAKVLLYGQLGVSALAVLFVLVQILRARSLVEIPPQARALPTALGASVQVGAILSLVAAGVMLAGGVLRLREKAP